MPSVHARSVPGFAATATVCLPAIQCDGGVAAAERQRAAGLAEQGGSGCLDLPDGLLDVERFARDVAGVRHLLRAERRHLQARNKRRRAAPPMA
jgi:hypothetical protein